MTPDARVDAVMRWGVTARQARFLVAVLRHGGVCVPRQYATFAGTAYGHTVNRFFDRLVAWRYASPCGCLHNRARVFHLQHRGLYEAIGEPHSPFRRPVTPALAVARLMRLDAVLDLPDFTWLTTRAEQVAGLTADRGIAQTLLPRAGASRARPLPDLLPLGMDGTDRVTVLQVVFDDDLAGVRLVLRRHLPLLRALPAWTWRVVLPRSQTAQYERVQTLLAEELEQPLDARTVEMLRTAFNARRADEAAGIRVPLRDAWSGLPPALHVRVHGLYQRWRRVGETALAEAVSRVLSDALAAGRGRVEVVVLPHAYAHLSPVLSGRAVTRGTSPARRRQRLVVTHDRDEILELQGLA